MGQTPGEFHYIYLEIVDRRLYYKEMNMPLTTKNGILRTASEIVSILKKNRLHKLGFNLPRGKVTAEQAIMLNKVEKELPSTSDVAKADDKELQEVMENAARSTENLTAQLGGESSKDLPMRELLGLYKQHRSIRGSLKVEMTKKVELQKCFEQERC